MIKCNEGKLVLDGNAGELVLDYVQITDALLKAQPEIVVSTFNNRKIALTSALAKSDAKAIQAFDLIIKICDTEG